VLGGTTLEGCCTVSCSEQKAVFMYQYAHCPVKADTFMRRNNKLLMSGAISICA